MNLKQHIRMTASEIAMGRYMRAPDHPTGQQAADEFANAFDDLAKEDEKPAAGAVDDKGGAGDGTGAAAAAGDGPTGAADDSGAGGSGDGVGVAAAGEDDKGGAPPAADDKTPAEGADKGDKGAGAGAGAAAPAAAEPPAAGADDKAGKDGKAVKAPAAAAAGEDDDALLKRLAKAVKTVDTEEKPAAAAAEEEKPIFSQEEEAKLDHFRKEWPEVAEAFDLQARALAHSVLKYAFGQIAEQFIPLRETVEILATRTHYGDLKEKVGEYTEAEREEIVDWVKQQPTYLQKPMMSVIEEGTAEEVADLVSRYREDTGKQPAGAGEQAKEPSGGDVELSDAAKQAAKDMAPVNSKRSAVTKQDDPSDFDGAFTKFADQLG